MQTQFITNEDKLLKEVFNNILPSSEQLRFLVGFFYFSGFEEIYKKIGDKHLRILVGMDVERGVVNTIREYDTVDTGKRPYSRLQIRRDYFSSFVDIFNHTDYFDSADRREAFQFFIKKIKDGSLEIKKTSEPNHAKLYIFEKSKEHSEGGEYPGAVITGSSNLSRAGLSGRREVNVITREKLVYKEATKLFEELWDKAVHIASSDDNEEFERGVLDKIWINKLPAPFLLYVRVLEEYFVVREKMGVKLPADITDGNFLDLRYQVDAIQRALDVIERHNGVIIADVVGLGKSVVASAVAHNLRLKTIVIAPPHLADQWNDYRYTFDFNAKVYGSRSIKKALDENSDDEQRLVIIDEAHKYRNEETIDYGSLHRLCQGNKVVLLSATPFNNRPQDIFSLVKLFQIPGRSTIRTIDSLSHRFRDLIKEYKDIQKFQRTGQESEEKVKKRIDGLAAKIRDILSPLVIRRSRLDLDRIKNYRKDLERQGVSFPKVNPPKIMDYELGPLSELYRWTLERIHSDNTESGFIGARYKPAMYIKDIGKYRKKIAAEFGDEVLFKQAQVNLAKFMRRLLVRRFESSTHAFRKTLDSMIVSSENIRDWYNRLGRVPIYKKGQVPQAGDLIDLRLSGEELEEARQDIDFEEELQSQRQKGLELVESKELRKRFIDDVEHDIALLKEIRQRWFEQGVGQDPKLDHFRSRIQEQLSRDPKRKIIVFTEFADTADYLYEQLKDNLRVFKYHSGEASAGARRTIRANFDASSKNSEDKFDVLIATDAISEGFNLSRAGTVFNYDIPYNPMRVIQRVGRINRIDAKVFDELFIYNFFPTETGEQETKTKEISTLKIAMHNALLGEDTKVLTSEEELRSFYVDEYNEALVSQEELSWDAEHINRLNQLKGSSPEVLAEAQALPKRVRVRRSAKSDKQGVLVFGKKGEEYTFKLGASASESVSLGAADALALFAAEESEKAREVSKKFEAIYQYVKAKLFVSKTDLGSDRGRQEAINKVEVLIGRVPASYRDYLNDLKRVIQELDALPKRYLKQIRAIAEESVIDDLKALQTEVSPRYLAEIQQRATEIEEGEESLILAEELV